MRVYGGVLSLDVRVPELEGFGLDLVVLLDGFCQEGVLGSLFLEPSEENIVVMGFAERLNDLWGRLGQRCKSLGQLPHFE